MRDSLNTLTETTLLELYRKREEERLRRLPIAPSTESKYGLAKVERVPGPGAYNV